MADESCWNIETLRTHLITLIEANDRTYRAKFEAAEKAVSAALTSAKEAVTKAEVATEKRLEGVNEFRGTLQDQQRTLIPRSEAELLMRGMEARLDALTTRLDKFEGGKRGATEGWGWAVGVFGLVAAVIALASRFMK